MPVCNILGVQKFVIVLCVAVGCSTRSGRNRDVSFFSLPKVINTQDKELYTPSKRRKDGYLAGISRVGLTDNIMYNNMYRIYSRHLISGKPADLLGDTNPDWLPTLNLGHSRFKLSSTVLGNVGAKEYKALQRSFSEGK